jgi:hypothetical protein
MVLMFYSETFVLFQRTTRRYIPEDRTLQNQTKPYQSKSNLICIQTSWYKIFLERLLFQSIYNVLECDILRYEIMQQAFRWKPAASIYILKMEAADFVENVANHPHDVVSQKAGI